MINSKKYSESHTLHNAVQIPLYATVFYLFAVFKLPVTETKPVLACLPVSNASCSVAPLLKPAVFCLVTRKLTASVQ